ncbi:MAG: sugar transferase [Chloroflexi bacterium]|nr:sugar transferase [Chloroflexota bacterium]
MKEFSNRFILFLFLADILFTELALYLAEMTRGVIPVGRESVGMSFLDLSIMLAVALFWAFFLRLFGAYDPRRLSGFVDEGRAVLLGTMAGMLALASFFYLFNVEFRSRILFTYFFAIDLALLLNYRLAARYIVRSLIAGGYTARRVVLVGATKVGRELAYIIRSQPWCGLVVVGFVDDDPILEEVDEGFQLLGNTNQLPHIIASHSVDDVIVALSSRDHEKIAEIVLSLQTHPVRVRVVPDLFEMVSVRAQVEDFWGVPLIGLRDPVITGFDRAFKRAFDLIISSILLLLLGPVMLLIAQAIKLDSHGPALFRQRRVGENGRLFWMYKFRTMVDGADKLIPTLEEKGVYANGVYKVKEDPRVTRVGHVLRRMSADELPQLFNVLRGEMSLVGPRPEQPWIVDRYEPWQRKRLSVMPGMTGWWQVNGRSDRPMFLNTEYDLYYIQNYSPILDLVILWKTIWVVLKGKGAF